MRFHTVALACLLLALGCKSEDKAAEPTADNAATPTEPAAGDPPAGDKAGDTDESTGEGADAKPDTDEGTGESADTKPDTDEATGEGPAAKPDGTDNNPDSDESTGEGKPTSKSPAGSKLDPNFAKKNTGPPKDLQVLPKSWSRKKVEAHMKTFNRGLGVKCKFCHEMSDFAANTNKHKAISREMIKMQNRINKQYFGGKQEVNCFTCHQGKAHPAK